MTARHDSRVHNRNRLAERVAEHGLIGRAAAEVGISQSYAKKLWAEILKEMGAQAV